jgi:hypothetical protein
MTIDISNRLYLSTQEIKDYARENDLDPTDIWKKVIDKFVELGAEEVEGYSDKCEYDYEVPEFFQEESKWQLRNYVGVDVDNNTAHWITVGSFGHGVIRTSLEQLLPELFQDKPFELEVGKVYKSGGGYVKIIHKVEGLSFHPFVGIRCSVSGKPLHLVGLYNGVGMFECDNPSPLRNNLQPISTEHPNVSKIKELEEQINKLKEEMSNGCSNKANT